MTEQIEVQEEQEATSLYVIQRQTNDRVNGEVLWEDVERVRVPQRARRTTILQKFLEEEPKEGLYRVLDADSAREMAVAPEEQPPKWRIG